MTKKKTKVTFVDWLRRVWAEITFDPRQEVIDRIRARGPITVEINPRVRYLAGWTLHEVLADPLRFEARVKLIEYGVKAQGVSRATLEDLSNDQIKTRLGIALAGVYGPGASKTGKNVKRVE